MLKVSRFHLVLATLAPISVALLSVGLGAMRSRPTAPAGASETAPDARGSKDRDDTVTLAVTAGRFDRMTSLLDTLGEGYRYEVIDEEQLRDPKTCARFGSIFLTCDEPLDATEDRELSAGLRTYVSTGGTLYASDLRFDALAAAFPERVDRTAVAQGLRQKVRAEVISEELRALVGAIVPLNFWLDGWRPAAFRGDDVTTLVKGRLRTTAGVMIEAPLLIKFPVGKGTVYFTSFHNEDDNSAIELQLLKYLALRTVTAALECRETERLNDDGFTPRVSVASGLDHKTPAVTRVYQHEQAGPLRFRLGFEGSKARMRLDVVSPTGERTTKRGDSTVAIDLPQGAPGRWQYTATAEKLPYPEFPTVLLVGVSGGTVTEKKNPALAATTGGNVRFQEVFAGNKNKPAARRQPRIAVSPPAFDDMGKLLLTLGAGYQFEVVTLDDRLKDNALNGFDIYFLTCNGWPGRWALSVAGDSGREGVSVGRVDPKKMERAGDALRRFVGRGGTLYASDLREQALSIAFPHREPLKPLSEALLPELDVAERTWLTLKVPGVKVDTVREALQKANLSPALRARFDRFVAGVESSKLVEGDLNEPGVNPPRIAWRMVTRYSIPCTAEDLQTIGATMKAWEARIVDAYRARKRPGITKTLPQIAQAERRLANLRKKITQGDQGRGNQTVQAQVVDPGLIDSLGTSALPLNFNANDWIPARFQGNDVTVLLRGEYISVGGPKMVAPLLIKFPEGQGTVIFTSFHNEAQNSTQEESLLRYLVFTAVTARAEAMTDQVMLTGGFSPAKRSQINHATGNASVTKSYLSGDARPLRFGLTFTGAGAKLRLTLLAPNKQRYTQEVDDSVVIEATGAPAGEWLYTVESLKVPYDNFPYSVSVGKGDGPAKTR